MKIFFKYQYELVKRAVEINNEDFNKIIRIDLQGYFPTYEKALERKEAGEIRKSANLSLQAIADT